MATWGTKEIIMYHFVDDATHAATAALCVFVFGDAMIKKLETLLTMISTHKPF